MKNLPELDWDTLYPNSPMPTPRPGIDMDDGKSIFSPELCREAIRAVIPAFWAESYIEEVENEKGEEFWSQFDSPAHAVHDATIYYDACIFIEVPPKVQGWNV